MGSVPKERVPKVKGRGSGKQRMHYAGDDASDSVGEPGNWENPKKLSELPPDLRPGRLPAVPVGTRKFEVEDSDEGSKSRAVSAKSDAEKPKVDLQSRSSSRGRSEKPRSEKASPMRNRSMSSRKSSAGKKSLSPKSVSPKYTKEKSATAKEKEPLPDNFDGLFDTSDPCPAEARGVSMAKKRKKREDGSQFRRSLNRKRRETGPVSMAKRGSKERFETAASKKSRKRSYSNKSSERSLPAKRQRSERGNRASALRSDRKRRSSFKSARSASSRSNGSAKEQKPSKSELLRRFKKKKQEIADGTAKTQVSKLPEPPRSVAPEKPSKPSFKMSFNKTTALNRATTSAVKEDEKDDGKDDERRKYQEERKTKAEEDLQKVEAQVADIKGQRDAVTAKLKEQESKMAVAKTLVEQDEEQSGVDDDSNDKRTELKKKLRKQKIDFEDELDAAEKEVVRIKEALEKLEEDKKAVDDEQGEVDRQRGMRRLERQEKRQAAAEEEKKKYESLRSEESTLTASLALMQNKERSKRDELKVINAGCSEKESSQAITREQEIQLARGSGAKNLEDKVDGENSDVKQADGAKEESAKEDSEVGRGQKRDTSPALSEKREEMISSKGEHSPKKRRVDTEDAGDDHKRRSRQRRRHQSRSSAQSSAGGSKRRESKRRRPSKSRDESSSRSALERPAVREREHGQRDRRSPPRDNSRARGRPDSRGRPQQRGHGSYRPYGKGGKMDGKKGKGYHKGDYHKVSKGSYYRRDDSRDYKGYDRYEKGYDRYDKGYGKASGKGKYGSYGKGYYEGGKRGKKDGGSPRRRGKGSPDSSKSLASAKSPGKPANPVTSTI